MHLMKNLGIRCSSTEILMKFSNHVSQSNRRTSSTNIIKIKIIVLLVEFDADSFDIETQLSIAGGL